MFRIRFHGRGGQGVKTAANVLGSAFFRAGFEVQDAPRYGAERRGAPIFAYVRAARTPINERGVITTPDLIVLMDSSLVLLPEAGVLSGTDEGTTLLVAPGLSAYQLSDRMRFPGVVHVLAVDGSGSERAPVLHIGARCAGAAACLVGGIARADLADAFEMEFASHGADVLAANKACGLAAFDAMAPYAGTVEERPTRAGDMGSEVGWIEVTADPDAIAAPRISAPATSALARTGLWRVMRPVIDYSHCNRCSWVCATLCPDSAIDVQADRTPRIDYDHCKGCLVCVAVCPPHAIRAVPETTMAGT